MANKLRMGLAGVVAAISGCTLALQGAAQPERQYASEPFPEVRDVNVGEWLECGDDGEIDLALERLRELIDASAGDALDEEPSPSPAITSCIDTLRGWLREDPESIFDGHLGRGLGFLRSRGESKVHSAVGWTFLDAREDGWLAEADDREVFREIFDAQQKSGLTIAAIDAGLVRFGRGVSREMISDEWPHNGMSASLSLFEGAEGPREDWEELEDGPATMNILIRVRLTDGRVGLIGLAQLYDDRVEMWVRVVASVAVFEGRVSPWPFAN